MTRECMIDGVRVVFRASALVPRLYRHLIGRDMIADMRKLQTAYNKAANDPDAAFSALDMEIFENVAWIMMRHAAEPVEEIGDDGNPCTVLRSGDMPVYSSPDEWLDRLDGVFSVYEVLPIILELWGANQQTTSVPAKK